RSKPRVSGEPVISNLVVTLKKESMAVTFWMGLSAEVSRPKREWQCGDRDTSIVRTISEGSRRGRANSGTVGILILNHLFMPLDSNKMATIYSYGRLCGRPSRFRSTLSDAVD